MKGKGSFVWSGVTIVTTPIFFYPFFFLFLKACFVTGPLIIIK